LFCHHLNDEELVKLFRDFNQYAKSGFVINDLQRNRLVYSGVWLITRILNGSSLSKNDGPISVLRAFKRVELNYLLKKAQVKNYSIKRKWAFRFLVVGIK
jgi:hypothetical protein